MPQSEFLTFLMSIKAASTAKKVACRLAGLVESGGFSNLAKTCDIFLIHDTCVLLMLI